MRLGYDLCEVVSEDIVGLLKSFKEDHITVFQLTKVDDCTYRFYLPIYQRIMVILCNQFIFRVEIIGNNPNTTKLVNQVLAENHIDVGDKKRTYQQLNDIYDDLKDSFKGKIDYLNIYQEGGVLFVKYTNSVGAKKVEKNFENIYASKDGVIQKIDVSSGNILVKLNQYVKKGDLLVSNTITSTSEVDKIIETEGTIKAYTYTTYEAKIDKKKMDDGEAFSYLLHTIRSKLGSIDKIDREKVLSYGIIDNKRVLKVQYILIEDIASKEEN